MSGSAEPFAEGIYYLKARTRMCHAQKSCSRCPMWHPRVPCQTFEMTNPVQAVAIVYNYAMSHKEEAAGR